MTSKIDHVFEMLEFPIKVISRCKQRLDENQRPQNQLAKCSHFLQV